MRGAWGQRMRPWGLCKNEIINLIIWWASTLPRCILSEHFCTSPQPSSSTTLWHISMCASQYSHHWILWVCRVNSALARLDKSLLYHQPDLTLARVYHHTHTQTLFRIWVLMFRKNYAYYVIATIVVTNLYKRPIASSVDSKTVRKARPDRHSQTTRRMNSITLIVAALLTVITTGKILLLQYQNSFFNTPMF